MSRASTGNSALRRRWSALSARERSLVLLAIALVALALLWWLALAPALATLRSAPARHAALDQQLQHMLSLQAEAQQLQASARARPGDSLATLRTTLAHSLGPSARLTVLGEHATVTLQGACADALAHWLAQARSSAQAAALGARLTRSPALPTAPAAPGAWPVALAGSSSPRASAPVAATATATTATSPRCNPANMPRWDGTLALALPAPAAD